MAKRKMGTASKGFRHGLSCFILSGLLPDDSTGDFAPPLSYTLLKEAPEDRIDDIFPERIFTKRKMLDFLDACRRKCKLVIGNITEENVQARWVEQDSPRNYLMIELLMYNMRHVQHHAAQMNIMLRNEINNAPLWVSRASV